MLDDYRLLSTKSGDQIGALSITSHSIPSSAVESSRTDGAIEDPDHIGADLAVQAVAFLGDHLQRSTARSPIRGDRAPGQVGRHSASGFSPASARSAPIGSGDVIERLPSQSGRTPDGGLRRLKRPFRLTQGQQRLGPQHVAELRSQARYIGCFGLAFRAAWLFGDRALQKVTRVSILPLVAKRFRQGLQRDSQPRLVVRQIGIFQPRVSLERPTPAGAPPPPLDGGLISVKKPPRLFRKSATLSTAVRDRGKIARQLFLDFQGLPEGTFSASSGCSEAWVCPSSWANCTKTKCKLVTARSSAGGFGLPASRVRQSLSG